MREAAEYAVMLVGGDPQSSSDARGLALSGVGIRGFQVPLEVGGWEAETTKTFVLPCTVKAGFSLDAARRGIHMSRIVEFFQDRREPVMLASLPGLLESLRESQLSQAAEVDIAFQWFMECRTPETEKKSWQAIGSSFHARWDGGEGTFGYSLRVPVTTLCPCSREISDYGAHSQRGWISARLEWAAQRGNPLPFVAAPGAVARTLVACGSAPVMPLLKRADERAVTMRAFENPAFVEDVARDAFLALGRTESVNGFSIEICNEESIHTHDAFARCARPLVR